MLDPSDQDHIRLGEKHQWCDVEQKKLRPDLEVGDERKTDCKKDYEWDEVASIAEDEETPIADAFAAESLREFHVVKDEVVGCSQCQYARQEVEKEFRRLYRKVFVEMLVRVPAIGPDR